MNYLKKLKCTGKKKIQRRVYLTFISKKKHKEFEPIIQMIHNCQMRNEKGTIKIADDIYTKY